MADPVIASAALNHFINSLEPEKVRTDRPMVEQFVAWYGEDESLNELTASDVMRYLEEEVYGEGAADETHLEPLRAFLAYSSRMAFTEENLVPALGLTGGARGGDGASEELGGNAYHVTLEGLQSLERQLDELRARRPDIADKLRTAMADKDFRENAPLDAARDEQAHLEARIRDIEERLRHAVIIDSESKRGRANVGSKIRLLNLDHNREQEFTLVSPTEVDPGNGKISIESPVGVAVRNKLAGDELIVVAPSGQIKFKLLEVIG
ncbi:MAG: hypothetical protein GEU80_01870 [Dehalococcoidia bacterium]|nr:hypothetical protein [Dehalococcoidia bacterium]